VPFVKGQSGNPSGRAIYKTKTGKTLADLAREHTEEAIKTLVSIMRNEEQPAAARVGAADKILNRGWGMAPQTIAFTDDREPLDLSGMTDEQLEAIETIRTLDTLTDGVAGSC
jgi:hypothetical protein